MDMNNVPYVFKKIITCWLSCICLVHAEDGASSMIRVAILRDAPSLGKALTEVCQHEYKGTIRVFKTQKGSYTAVNTLDIEDYLLGVIGREISPNAPLEALKAQAIAARSHALYMASISRDQPYDLVANLSQAYLGKARLHKNVVLAIEITRGQILYYRGKAIPAYFHTSCGGHTISAISVWPPTCDDGDIQPRLQERGQLPGTTKCPWCSASSENKWNAAINVATFLRVFKQAGHRLGGSPWITIVERSASGHALKIAIESETGKLLMPADKFRAILGYSTIQSACFNVDRPRNEDGTPGDRFIFRGDGCGHGVGLCQLGALAMAEKGARCDSILAWYFPNCRIRPCVLDNLVSAR